MTEAPECPKCGSTVIVRMQDDQFRCFNCDYIWDDPSNSEEEEQA